MHVLTGRNVNELFPRGIALLREHGRRQTSRNGDVIVFPTPVTSVYICPWERVLFDQTRDANPYFHLIESIWMLAGRNDVASVAKYVSRMRTYSDDGVTLNGAYGERWRRAFDHDQLLWAIKRLKADPSDRRVVIGMWDPANDPDAADAGSKDVPCNTQLYLWIDSIQHTNTPALHMTVTCRSNDIIWGAYGANAVHFSMLQDFLAQALGVTIGPLYQVSNNFHAYPEVLEKQTAPIKIGKSSYPPNFPCYLGRSAGTFLEECEEAFEPMAFPDLEAWSPYSLFLGEVVRPAMLSHRYYKDGNLEQAHFWANKIASQDWQLACVQWLERRRIARERAADDGVLHE